jgi:hypothetical protein
MILSLGVVDIPYTHDPSPAKTFSQKRRQKRNDIRAAFGEAEQHGTTYEVAQILEARYHIIEIFWELHGQEIADTITEDMRDFLDDRMSGSGRNKPTFIAAESEAKTLFNTFINSKEMDSLGYPGVPTRASLRGVNHSFLHPYSKNNPPRPSFRDTGLFRDSFVAWMSE